MRLRPIKAAVNDGGGVCGGQLSIVLPFEIDILQQKQKGLTENG